MRRGSARLRRPIATAFSIWADFALHGGKRTTVAVIPTADAPPAKAAPARKPKTRRRAKR